MITYPEKTASLLLFFPLFSCNKTLFPPSLRSCRDTTHPPLTLRIRSRRAPFLVKLRVADSKREQNLQETESQPYTT